MQLRVATAVPAGPVLARSSLVLHTLRLLVRPPTLGALVIAGLAAGSIVVWHAWATQPEPDAAPELDLIASAQVPRESITRTSLDPLVPAPPAQAPTVLRLVDAEVWNSRVFASDARFPAISEDGKTIVDLFQDEEDFTAAPITTLVAWSRGARTTMFSVGGEGSASRPGDDRVLRRANAWLAKFRWQPLDGTVAIGTSEDGELSTIIAPSGATLEWRASTGTLSRVRGAKRRAIRATFPAPGTSMESQGGCGEIRGIARAFGDEHLLVLVPSANLGGDSCFGTPSAELAISIALD